MSKLTIGPGRISFPNIFEPAAGDMGGGKYAMTILLPPETDLKPLFAALEEAAVEKFGADKSKWPKGAFNGPKSVIRAAADKSHLAGYEPGWHFISMKSKSQPGIVDAVRENVTDPREVYAGRWCRVTARAFGYDTILKGVGFGLQNVQLLKNDTPFSGGGRAQDDFDDFAEELGALKPKNWDD